MPQTDKKPVEVYGGLTLIVRPDAMVPNTDYEVRFQGVPLSVVKRADGSVDFYKREAEDAG